MDKIIKLKSIVYDTSFNNFVLCESNPIYLRVTTKLYKNKTRYNPCKICKCKCFCIPIFHDEKIV